MRKLGFTLIEMLVVISIIGILLSVSAVAYSSVSKQSRDARRKTDLEQLRAALEQYRSANDTYPGGDDINDLIVPLTGDPKYIESIPVDPKPNTTTPYDYDCPNPAGYCNSYELKAHLETSDTDYIVTPYGVSSGNEDN